MILYFETSAVVKLYAQEMGSEDAEELASRATLPVTSILTYVEVRAALAAKWRGGSLVPRGYTHPRRSTRHYDSILGSFERQWPDFAKLPVGDHLVQIAGGLAERYGLAGFDAIHLASAIGFGERSDEAVRFTCWDDRLRLAAAAEGLDILPE